MPGRLVRIRASVRAKKRCPISSIDALDAPLEGEDFAC
jgi:hypothetical protein